MNQGRRIALRLEGRAAQLAAGRVDVGPLALADVDHQSAPPQPGEGFPWKSQIVTTVFWIGEKPTENNPVPNRASSWDKEWSKEAESLYERVRQGLGAQGGRFGARMALELVNDGPVTLVLDT